MLDKDFKTLTGVRIPVEVHVKIWAYKKARKIGSISDTVSEILEEWSQRDGTEVTYATHDELETYRIRLDKIETQLSLLRYAVTNKVEDQFKKDEYKISDLLEMSWPRLKTLCAKYGLNGVKDHHAAIMVLRNKVTLIDDINQFTEDTEQTEQPEETEEEEQVHFCKYCSQRDHREDKCPHKKEDKQFKKKRPPTPCQKCGGFHRGDCKMGE